MKVIDRDTENRSWGISTSELRLNAGLTMLETVEEEQDVSQAIAIQLIEALECVMTDKPAEALKIFHMTGKLIGELYISGGLTRQEFADRETLKKRLQICLTTIIDDNGKVWMVSVNSYQLKEIDFGNIKKDARKLCDNLKGIASGEVRTSIFRAKALYSQIMSKKMDGILIYCFHKDASNEACTAFPV